jgi:hypothetical protein
MDYNDSSSSCSTRESFSALDNLQKDKTDSMKKVITLADERNKRVLAVLLLSLPKEILKMPLANFKDSLFDPILAYKKHVFPKIQ